MYHHCRAWCVVVALCWALSLHRPRNRQRKNGGQRRVPDDLHFDLHCRLAPPGNPQSELYTRKLCGGHGLTHGYGIISAIHQCYRQCPLWVRNRHSDHKHQGPLYLSKQTLIDRASASCLRRAPKRLVNKTNLVETWLIGVVPKKVDIAYSLHRTRPYRSRWLGIAEGSQTRNSCHPCCHSSRTMDNFRPELKCWAQLLQR